MRDTFAVSKLLVMFFPDLLPYLRSSLAGKVLPDFGWRKKPEVLQEKQSAPRGKTKHRLKKKKRIKHSNKDKQQNRTNTQTKRSKL